VAMKFETIAQTVKRLRLQRAGYELASTDMSVEAVGKRCGYSNLQSFTRIFADYYDMPPGEYRLRGTHRIYDSNVIEKETNMYDLEIRNVDKITLAGLAHQGSYMDIGNKFEQVAGLGKG
jgi:AraC family transcriptional regulator